MLQAARNNKTKVSPPSTRCSSTQLFHTLISWHVNMYCIYEAACERSLESPVPQALTRLISASFSPPKWIQKRGKWSHVRACQKDYLFSQSVTVCSMYIDDPSLCIYKSVQVWYSYSHSGFFSFLFSFLFAFLFNESHSNISVINKKAMVIGWVWLHLCLFRKVTVNDQTVRLDKTNDSYFFFFGCFLFFFLFAV